MRRPLLLFIGIGCFASCHKSRENPNASWNWFGTDNPAVYSYVLINANQVTNRADSNDFHIAIAAAFVDSNNHRITGVDNLLVNNKPISMNVDSTFQFDYKEQSDLSEGIALYGTNVLITVKGKTDADTVTSTVYLPKKIVRVVSDFPAVISQSSDLTLSWIADPGNPWGNVIIQMYYYSDLSQDNSPDLPQQVKTLNFTVADNGSYTISKKSLNTFPLKSYVGITIARGTQNQAVLPVSKKRIFYFSNSSASTPPLYVDK